MASTTSRLALPYPVGTDTPDVPRDVLALANRLEAVITPPGPLGLPGTHYDGQLAYLAPATGVTWAFRWNAATAQWDFIGGAPLIAVVEAQEAITGVAGWTDPPTIGPSIVVPRAGDYDVEWWATVANGASVGAFISAGPAPGASAPGVAATATFRGASDSYTISGIYRFTAVPVSTEIRLRYYQSTAAGQVGGRRLRVRPARVT